MKASLTLRTRILSGAFVALALVLIIRLYFVQIVHGESYRQQGMGQYVALQPDTADRGDIYFTTKTGALVAAAVMQHGWRIAIDPETMGDAAKTYAALNALTPIDRDAFFASAAKKSDPYEEVAYRLDDRVAGKVRALALPGVLLVQDQWRSYPAGSLAAQVIGFVGYNGGNSKTGVYGLEKYWNSTLSLSSSGLYVNPFAEIFTNLEAALSADPAGHQGSIITSIEPNTQRELESALDRVMQKYSPQFAGGIIMDPRTGKIYAMAQRPGFDPNTYNLVSDPSVFKNNLVSGRFELGSIMKPLTMAAGIDSGAVTPTTTYEDTGCITVSSAKVCNWDLKPRGVIPMQQILTQSLNVGASWVATKTGYPTFTHYFQSYGLGQRTGIDLPDEVSGDLSNLGNGTEPAVNYDTASFGQGIAVSPIEMIRAVSAIGNGGYLPNPHVVTAIRYEDGVTRSIDPGNGPRVISTTTADAVNSMLEQVYDVAEGNGKYKMARYTAAAKTGTAQIPKPGGGYYPMGTFLHSFFGYVPASDPRFIVFLFAYKPQGIEYAADSLGPTYYEIEQWLINYYNIPPDR